MKQLLTLVFTAILALAVVPVASADPASVQAPAQSQMVNLNTPDAQALTSLRGIGLKKAQDIVAWRDANGGFSSVEQLADIKGIGAATLAANRDRLTLE